MNWHNDELLPLKYGLNNEVSSCTYEQKQQIKSLYENETCTICSRCGGEFYKMYQYIISDDKIIPFCQLCYIITHYTPKNSKMLSIGKTNLSQLEINRKTIEFIKGNRKIPEIIEVDPNVEITYFHPIQFYKDPTNTKFKNCKIFFTNGIDLSKILLVHSTINDFDDYEIIDNDYKKTVIDDPHDIILLLEKWNIKIKQLESETNTIKNIEKKLVSDFKF